MNNLYNKIYEAVDTGIQKALIIRDDQIDDVPVIWNELKKTTEFKPYEYRFVDMGLESGLLWAEYNLGAFPGSKAEDWYGDYYAWGETEPKNDYSWKSYKHCKGTSYSLIKYNNDLNYGIVDNKKILDINDDVVSQILGAQYRMPTKEEFDELLNNTVNKWIENYKGIQYLNGRLLTSKNNGNTLFFPAAGYFYDTIISSNGSYGIVWSASLHSIDPTSAWQLGFHTYNIHMKLDYRRNGLSVRAVQDFSLK